MHIGLLARQVGTTPHRIRFSERQGLLPQPPRGANRDRDDKQVELHQRVEPLRNLDQRLAHLLGDLAAGENPRRLLIIGKEARRDATA